ncbi:hypothetical protein ABZS94_44065 [Streptomyces sp. NPDC005500]|uniref:hypothetical protein n=1 Tax=Streptomyces sp. NPDC005500 TaxID=3155007 RepID=UPI0033AC79F2
MTRDELREGLGAILQSALPEELDRVMVKIDEYVLTQRWAKLDDEFGWEGDEV